LDAAAAAAPADEGDAADDGDAAADEGGRRGRRDAPGANAASHDDAADDAQGNIGRERHNVGRLQWT